MAGLLLATSEILDADQIWGGSGDDVVYGDSGADSLYGNLGKDTMFGGGDPDTMEGNEDSDWMSGGQAGDVVVGGTRAAGRVDEGDTLFGDSGPDTIIGGQLADAISRYLRKGDPILVEGRLRLDQWEGKNGKQSKIVVVVDHFEFVGGRRDRDRGAAQHLL